MYRAILIGTQAPQALQQRQPWKERFVVSDNKTRSWALSQFSSFSSSLYNVSGYSALAACTGIANGLRASMSPHHCHQRPAAAFFSFFSLCLCIQQLACFVFRSE